MAEEYNVPADSQSTQVEMFAFDREVLKPLFSSLSGQLSSLCSLLSFISAFYAFNVEICALFIAMATFFLLIFIAWFFIPIIGTLGINLAVGIITMVFCIRSYFALRNLQSEKTSFDPVFIKRASVMPAIRGVFLCVYSGLFLLTAVLYLCYLAISYSKAQINQDVSGTLWEYLFDNSTDSTFIYILLFLGVLLLFCASAWFGIKSYYSRIYEYAEFGKYEYEKRPPYGRMILATLVCILSLNIPSALYMITTMIWFKKLHAGIAFYRRQND